MIARYALAEMTALWSEEEKYKIWFDVEYAAAEAMHNLGVVPQEALLKIKAKAHFTIDRIHAIEARTKHDVIAFLDCLAEHIGEEARYLHLGMTSSDLIDTALSIRMVKGIDIIITKLQLLLEALKDKALTHKYNFCMGRSHGIHAEPTTLGLKFAGYYAECQRNLKRLLEARKEIGICAISGPVGTFATVDPYVQKYVAQKFQLMEEQVSTQVIPRDRHAFMFAAFALLASAIERLATEIRHLQRTELREMEEDFSKGQKGSSAMPHKKNPILSENLCGIARMIKSYVTPALDNINLWHERDISHSSIERIMIPDSMILLDFALDRATQMILHLKVHTEKALNNIQITKGLIFSQRALLALINKGMIRDKAYYIIQEVAMDVWQNLEDKDFISLLKKHKAVNAHLSEKDIEDITDMHFYDKHIDTIFNTLF